MSRSNRREFLKVCSSALLLPSVDVAAAEPQDILVNDVQTKMNATRVARIVPVHSIDDIQKAIYDSKSSGRSIAIAGGRHASGGQQFGTGEVLVDMTTCTGVRSFDQERGLITVDGGTEWPALMSHYLNLQKDMAQQWGIAQKQGGLDRLTIGGTLSANAHGHTLTLPPIVSNIESFELMDANGNVKMCSRNSNAELFRCAIGGYGLFGVITSVTLQLVPRRKLRRDVSWANTTEAIAILETKAAQGSLYGDFQYSIDEMSPDFLRRGILTTYDPIENDSHADDLPNQLSADDIEKLLLLAHSNRQKAFQAYAEAALASSGEIVWSDTHQYSPYPGGYHGRIDAAIHSKHPGSDTLAEMYVPRGQLSVFLAEAREVLFGRRAEVIYGTVRLIRRDTETFLAWAKQDYACVIFTLHTQRMPGAVARTFETFRALASMAVARGGSYYLTYNRFAGRELLDRAYPQFAEFLRLKKKYDPHEVFQSTWYRAYLSTHAQL